LPLRTLDFLVATGQIPFFRVGKRNVRFDEERLREWTRDQEGVEYRRPSKGNGRS
jgi:excisionase family DNA binding protein